MKKIALICIMVMSVFSLTGCGSKTALTSDEFNKILGDEGFAITDVTSQMEDSNIEVIAAANNGKYQLEYHVYKTNEAAKKAYDGNEKSFKSYKKSNSKEKEIQTSSYDKYTLELSDEYKVISRIDNKLVYASISLEYKKDLDKLLDKLGY